MSFTSLLSRLSSSISSTGRLEYGVPRFSLLHGFHYFKIDYTMPKACHSLEIVELGFREMVWCPVDVIGCFFVVAATTDPIEPNFSFESHRLWLTPIVRLPLMQVYLRCGSSTGGVMRQQSGHFISFVIVCQSVPCVCQAFCSHVAKHQSCVLSLHQSRICCLSPVVIFPCHTHSVPNRRLRMSRSIHS